MPILFPDELAIATWDWAELPPDPVIDAFKADVDRTLLVERLKRTVSERFDDLMRLQEFAEELRRAGRRTP